jgi:hypothetical protein
MQAVMRIVNVRDGPSLNRHGVVRLWPDATMHVPRTIRKSFPGLG